MAEISRSHDVLENRTKMLCVAFRQLGEARKDPSAASNVAFRRRVLQLDSDARQQAGTWWQAQLDKELRDWRCFPLFTVIQELRRSAAGTINR